MRTSTRWTLLILAMAVVIVVALAGQLRDRPSSDPGTPGPVADMDREHRSADTERALAGARQRAGLPPCPEGGDDPGPEALRGVFVECAADGSRVDVARALAGRPVVLNLWAYWCGPCAQELPAMAEYQRRAGSEVMVVTVHQNPNQEAALLRLAELGVVLPTLQDPDRRIAAALGVPNVMPATVLLKSDGTVAQILPRSFASADEVAAAVTGGLR